MVLFQASDFLGLQLPRVKPCYDVVTADESIGPVGLDIKADSFIEISHGSWLLFAMISRFGTVWHIVLQKII